MNLGRDFLLMLNVFDNPGNLVNMTKTTITTQLIKQSNTVKKTGLDDTKEKPLVGKNVYI